MDPELPQIFLATDVDGEGFNMEHNGDYEQNPKSLGDGGSGENVDGSEDGGSDKSSEDNDHGERKLYNGSTDGQDEEEYEDQVEEDDDDDSASSSSDTATTSSSSRRRLVIKNVKYFAKHNLERYLKRRGFDVYQKPPSTVGLDKLIENIKGSYENYSRLNTISSGTNYDGNDVIKEIDRFWKFYLRIKEDAATGTELKSLLVPVFVCLYHECLLCGSVQHAVKMFATFVQQFFQESPSTENQILLTMLAKISCASNFQVSRLREDPLIKQLSGIEYKFRISPALLNQLCQFLQESKSSVFPNLFTQKFSINVVAETAEPLEKADAPKEAGQTADDDDELSQSEIHTVIHQLRGSRVANLPSVLVYTTNGKSISGAISKQGSVVAYGMDGAGIHVFEALPQPIGLKNSVKGSPNEIGSNHKASVLNGHAGPVYDLSFHPKSKYLFSVGEDALMRVWDIDNGSCRAVYRGHHSPVWSLDIANSGNLLASGSMDTTARIWVPERTDYVRLLVGHYFDVDCVKFHPNEAYVATGSVDKSVRLWSVSNGNLVRMFTGSSGAINCLAFHSSGKYICGAGEDNIIRIWELGEGKLVAQLEANSNCRDLQFHDDMLAAAFANGAVRVWFVRDILQTTTAFPEDLVSACEPSTFDSQSDFVVKLYYKNLGQLFCLASKRVVNFGTT